MIEKKKGTDQERFNIRKQIITDRRIENNRIEVRVEAQKCRYFNLRQVKGKESILFYIRP